MENQNNDKQALEAIQKKLREQHLTRLNNQKAPEDAMLRFSAAGEIRLRLVPGVKAVSPDIFPCAETIAVMGQRYIVPQSPLLREYITQQRIRLFSKAGKERTTPHEKVAFEAAKGMFPKLRWFAPVVERGNERAGVRIWSLSQKLYGQIYGFYADETLNGFMDAETGRDLVVSVKPGSFASASVNYPDSVELDPNASSLSDDEEQAHRWLEYVRVIDIDNVLASMIAPEADLRAAVLRAVECGGIRAGREPDTRFQDITEQLDKDLAGLLVD